jgi:hypothetical protein
VFFSSSDRELGLACVRAWNDWLFEEWWGPIAIGSSPRDHGLADPERGADEIRHRNARLPPSSRTTARIGFRRLMITGSRSSARARRPRPSSASRRLVGHGRLPEGAPPCARPTLFGHSADRLRMVWSARGP